MSEQPVIETPIEKRNGHRGTPRVFSPDDRRALVAEHDALPAQGGHRKAWLREHRISSSMMSQWRRRQDEPARPDGPTTAERLARANREIQRMADRVAEVERAGDEALARETDEANAVITGLKDDIDLLEAELAEARTVQHRAEASAANHGWLYRRARDIYASLDELLADVTDYPRPVREVIERADVEERLGTAQDALYDALVWITAWEAQTCAAADDCAKAEVGQ